MRNEHQALTARTPEVCGGGKNRLLGGFVEEGRTRPKRERPALAACGRTGQDGTLAAAPALACGIHFHGT